MVSGFNFPLNQPIKTQTFRSILCFYSLPILDTLQKKKSLLVNVDISINTKRLVRISLYPFKIDLVDNLLDISPVAVIINSIKPPIFP